MGLPGGTSGKESACQCKRYKRCGFTPWVGKIPWRRAWQSTSVFLPGECHEQRSLVGFSPQGRKESDTTETTSHAACLGTKGIKVRWSRGDPKFAPHISLTCKLTSFSKPGRCFYHERSKAQTDDPLAWSSHKSGHLECLQVSESLGPPAQEMWTSNTSSQTRTFQDKLVGSFGVHTLLA